MPAGIPFRELNVLSPGDLDTLNRMYGRAPTMVTVTTNPPGLKLVVDGTSITTPQVFPWADGSTHAVDVPDPQTTAAARYLFGRWSDGGAQSHIITAAPAKVTLYTANLIRLVKVATDITPPGAGP